MNEEGQINNLTQNLEAKVGSILRVRNLTLSTAESCTGGLVGHLLTNVPGSSEYYLGGIISYDNIVKQNVLGVASSVLETAGAVSPECALAMAKGVQKFIGTSLGISTTGIAGPGGSTPDKPVGLVYIGIVDNAGFERVEKFVWESDRMGNKELSARAALQILLEYLKK